MGRLINWRLVLLGDAAVAVTMSGGTPTRTNPTYFGGSIKWVKSGELDDNWIFETEETITYEGLQKSSAKVFPAETVLVAMYGATAGKTAILKTEAATNQAVCAIIPQNGAFDCQFLQYQLIHLRPRILRARSGGAQPNISQRVLSLIEIRLPPVDEQRDIAHALRIVQEAKEARLRELALERERKASLMQYLFTHGTRDERRKQTDIGQMPESWCVSRLEEFVISGPQNGLYKPLSLYGEGTPIIRITDFDNDGRFTNTSLNRVKLSSEEATNFSVTENDILVNRVNSLSHLGKSVLVPKLSEQTVFESNMMRLRVDEVRLLPQYLAKYLVTPENKERIRSMARRAVAQSSINQGDVKALRLPMPELAEQRQIVAILQACKLKMVSLENEAFLLDELFKAILEELMTGRLSATSLIEANTAHE
jgi:type I restriction enzyme, S subunit